MDFARKQLEKYGWSDGKGLGKYENGISQPLKPKLKRSITGVGYDAAADFTEHWWSTLYNKAASNVEIEEKNGKTKKIRTKDSAEFVITNSTWRLNKKKKMENSETLAEYSDNFVRTAVLTSGGSKTQNIKESESEGEEDVKVVQKLTDEELFAACEGRTAHKGARHGLKALGKLARIEQQEQILLQQLKYVGYSHTKKKNSNESVVEEMNLNDDSNMKRKIKKKKKKRCNSYENDTSNFDSVAAEDKLEAHMADCKNIVNKNSNEVVVEADILNSNSNVPLQKKKKKKSNSFEIDTTFDNITIDVSTDLCDKKIIYSENNQNKNSLNSDNVEDFDNHLNNKKNRRKHKIVPNRNESVDLSSDLVVKKRKNKIKNLE